MDNSSSLKTRITVALTIAITAILTLYGAAETLRIADEQRAWIDDRAKAALSRLEVTLPGPLWDFALPTVQQIIRAEMASRAVKEIRVYGVDGQLIAGERELENGKIRDIDPKDAPTAAIEPEGSVL